MKIMQLTLEYNRYVAIDMNRKKVVSRMDATKLSKTEMVFHRHLRGMFLKKLGLNNEAAQSDTKNVKFIS